MQEIKEYIDLILKQDPKAKDMEVVFEPRSVWEHYHLSDGCARRGQHGKKDVVVFRLPN